MAYKTEITMDSDGRTVIRYTGDAQAAIDACAARARAEREVGRARKMPEMRKIMSIDPVVLMKIAHDHNLSYFDPKVFEIAKGRDFSKFRTAEDRRYFRGK